MRLSLGMRSLCYSLPNTISHDALQMNAFIASDKCVLCWRQNTFIANDECVLCWRQVHFALQRTCWEHAFELQPHTHIASYQTELMWRWLLYSHSQQLLTSGRIDRIDRKVLMQTVQAHHVCITASWSGAKHDCLIQVSLYSKIIALQTTCYVDLYYKEEKITCTSHSRKIPLAK